MVKNAKREHNKFHFFFIFSNFTNSFEFWDQIYLKKLFFSFSAKKKKRKKKEKSEKT